MKADETTAWYLVFVAWLIASVSTLGALFFGEVVKVPTCVLCWYQRIFMFPLALILPIGLFPFDRKVLRYALPLAAIGGLIALYHVLLVAGVIPETMQPCTQGVPCKEQVMVWLGFVTIPLLALLAFVAIVVLLCIAHFRSPK
ncbi:MAG: 2-oxoglutarate dehydrogenase [Betaproteobacteria bacterium RIFCSPLOWO2_02_67_12]|nr:MAG: 2-oxoglutarate dehydrogenase [Betaproteobacteria bacterium RIFCSPLOWO2_02_67_12]